MSRWDKLTNAVKSNPRNVRLQDAIWLAEQLGFKHRRGGKHPHLLKLPGHPRQLNFQSDGNGIIPLYQARQLLAAIEELSGKNE